MVIRWICSICNEINSDKKNKKIVYCGACGKKFKVKVLLNDEYAIITNIENLLKPIKEGFIRNK